MITFGLTPNILTEFNTFEALFWILLSGGVFVAIRFAHKKYRSWLYFNVINLFLFGITDIVELYTGGFLHTAQWLLGWKIVHVCGLVIGIVWYLKIRLKGPK